MDWIKCISRRLLRAARRQAGVTLIEVVCAIALFGIVATSLMTVLTSATVADGLSRQRSIALELAQQEIEYVRQLSYMNVGVCYTFSGSTCTSAGNPPGVVAATQEKRVMGLWYTLTTRVRWVNDPVPTSFATYANYKQVRVTVTRKSDNKRLARVYTYVSSATRQNYGGANNAIINATVSDYFLNTPLQGATVNLWDGPSPNSSDVTDETGSVTFPALTPNNAGAPYYDVTASLIGYSSLWEETLKSIAPGATVPPGSTTTAESIKVGHIALSDSETQAATLHLYKPSTIYLNLLDASTNPYTGVACISLGAPGPNRGSKELAVDGGGVNNSYTFTTLPTSNPASTNTEQIVPGPTYTVAARTFPGATTSNVCTVTSAQTVTFAPLLAQTVPDDYANNNNATTFGLELNTTPSSFKTTVRVTARKSCPSGSTISGARVDLRDGPVPIYLTGTTNSSGYYDFYNVPYGTSNYDVLAWTSTVHGTLSNQTISSTSPSGSPPNICIPVATAN